MSLTVEKKPQAVKKAKKTKLKLPDWVHKIKIRYYKNIYPDVDDIVIVKLNELNEKIGCYMDMIEFENKEGIVPLKEIARSSRLHIIKNTFSNETCYPLVVTDRDVRRRQEEEEDYCEISDDEEEYDFTDPSLEVSIYLSNRVLPEEEQKKALKEYVRYKHVHSMLHNYGFMVKQSMLKSQEEADNIVLSEYTDFLQSLAENTIWKYPVDKIADIIQEIRDNPDKQDEYFELDDFHKEQFRNAINRSIPKTKYTGVCHIKMQTLEIAGIKVIQNALENINKTGINVQVISAPEYALKLETGDIEKIKDRFEAVLNETATYMNNHLGFIKMVDCKISNNMNENIVNVKFDGAKF